MKKRKKIGKTITGFLLSAVFLTMFLHGIVSVWSLFSMKRISMDTNRELGKKAAEDAQDALEKIAGEQLQNIAKEKAAYIGKSFTEVTAYVHGIASMAEEIYENPQNYPDRIVLPPQPGCRGLSAQLLKSWKQKEAAWQNQELLKLGNIQDLLIQYNANNEMVSSAYVATGSGWLIQADSIAYSKFNHQEKEPVFYEAETRQWYQRALKAKQGEIVYSDVIADVHGGGDCIVCAQPVYHKGKVVAVAGAGSYLDTVYHGVLKTAVGENGYAFLVNKNGQIMVSPQKEGETAAKSYLNLLESKNKPLSDICRNMTAGQAGIERVTIDGKDVYLAYAPLKELGWSCATVIDVAEVIAPAQESHRVIITLADAVGDNQDAAIGRMLVSFLLITICAAVIISILGAVYADRITDPIRRLTDEVKTIGKGDLEHRIQIRTGDEIEDLGEAFNSMTSQIKNYISNLSEITAEKERIRTELTVASRLQADMLPLSQDAFPGRAEFELWAQMTPAREVGGDFYDFFLTDEDHLVFMVADVSGKGVPAALFMVVAKTLIRSRMKVEPDPAKVFTDTNKSLYENNRDGMFVTAWLGILTLSTGDLVYVNAGHNPPLIKTGGRGEFSWLDQRTGFVLAGMDGLTYDQAKLKLIPGDQVFLYTDGVTEAHDTGNELYGEIRLKSRLEKWGEFPPGDQISAVWEDVQAFKGKAEQFDDITMLALCYKGDGYQKNHGLADLSRMAEIEDFVESILKEQAVRQVSFIKIMIAVDEIFSNICRYSKAKEVTIACKAADGKIKLFFEDDGIPFNPLEKPDPDVTDELERKKAGGYGIYIVKKSMDSLVYEFIAGKNRLLLMKIA
ncbi:hypothetical protein LAD12857_26680 [Lacrimispora amygdalina]|uniref:HAMP domain-containing protein n=1 Tax=Lacrimispora amygdalina TaxID=253257 RepID=A0ABQ5M729_9FIRM